MSSSTAPPDLLQALARREGDLVVTSEESLLRGPDELQAFLRAYVHGRTTYSWTWERLEISTADTVAWLLAERTESAATQDWEQSTPTA